MFWDMKTRDHSLPRNPFKSCVVPRPIGWISSISPTGDVNLAPYSYFNACGEDPCMVMFSGSLRPEGGFKDTVANVESQGEFVANIATWDLREEMNQSSAALPAGQDETAFAGLDTEPARLVTPPRIKGSPIHLECVYHTTVVMPSDSGGEGNHVVFGRVLGIHIDDVVLTDGFIDMAKVKPIARLGYMDYTRVDLVFAMGRPKVEAVE